MNVNQIEIEIQADINPTEDEVKVKQALENLFGALQFELKPQIRGSVLLGRTKGIDGLTKLQNILRRERIRAAARAVLYGGKGERNVVFYLNKQVAYAGHVSFCQPVGESPLGPLKVEIQCDDPRELIEWLAPKTA